MRIVIGLFVSAIVSGATVGCGGSSNPGVIDPGIVAPPPQALEPGAMGAAPPQSGGSMGDPMEYTK